MSDQLELFADMPHEAKIEAAGYHLCDMRDCDSPACLDCAHMHEGKGTCSVDEAYRFISRRWICRLRGKEVHPDLGTCGSWEGFGNALAVEISELTLARGPDLVQAIEDKIREAQV